MWETNGVFERLDWVLCNWEWKQKYENAYVDLLPYKRSNHRPVLLRLRDNQLGRTEHKVF